MARIVGGSPLGTLSGKMGGFVFAHNKSGPYVRQYVVPVNPNTGAQVSARASFASGVSSFHSLTPAQKTQWQNFAQTSFNPKNAINTGQFSSINAYTALRTMVNQGNKLNYNATIGKNGTPLAVQPSFELPTFSETPPVFAMQPNFKEFATGDAITIGDIEAEIRTDGSFDVVLNINPGVTGAPTLAGFVDAVDHEIGFAVYMSNANVQGGLFYQNQEKICLGYIPFNDADQTDLTAVETIELSGIAAIDTADYQAFPVAGNYVRISVYIIDNKSGQGICIGPAKPKSGGTGSVGDIQVELAP